MKINVVGLGYIGLPTALMLASHGSEVTGTDRDKELVSRLQQGRGIFNEDGLQELFDLAVANGIQFSGQYQKADVYVIAVPTPYIKKNKKVDASYIVQAVGDVLEAAPKGAIMIIESTVSPGTIDKHVRPVIKEHGLICGEDIHLVHAPERIIPGSMIKELEWNNRTIGADDPETGERVKKLYQTFCRGEIVVTNIVTAEMTKVVENTYRDINIAFANELAKICRSDRLDVYEIIRIANMHPRVNILSPGPGVGGHCISVDPWFLVGDYPGLANIILAARKINDSMPEFVLERMAGIMEEHGIRDTAKVGLYGLTYKENVDDLRESPTLQLLECMRKHLAHGVKIYDPFVEKDVVENQYHSFDSFIHDTEFIVIMVGHDQIVEKQELLADKIVLDTRNICSLDHVYRL